MINSEKFKKILCRYENEYCPDNPVKYSKEVKDCPAKAYWEKWLTAFCLFRGLNVQTRMQRNSEPTDGRPDIKIILDNGVILWIECVTPGNATNSQHKVKDPISLYYGKELKVFPIPTEAPVESKLRITNALAEKHKQYLARRKSDHIGQNEHYIIAVNTADIGIDIWGCFSHNIPPVAQVCYGLKGTEVFVPSSKGMQVEHPREFAIKKNSKAIVESAFLLREEHVDISAVIEGHIADKALLGLANIYLWNNHHAKNSLPNSLIEKLRFSCME